MITIANLIVGLETSWYYSLAGLDLPGVGRVEIERGRRQWVRRRRPREKGNAKEEQSSTI